MAKKLTDAERLQHGCPKCGARPGFACVDFKGHPAPLCVERGRPEITAKKLQKKADEKNARLLAAYGGENTLLTDFYGGADALLEAHGETKVTASALAAQKLHAERFKENDGHAEWGLREAFNWITIRCMRRVAAALIGAEWEAKIWEKCDKTYGANLPYIVDRYGQCLCSTARMDLVFARHEEKVEPSEWNRSGVKIRIEVVEHWPPADYAPVMTREEFGARFRLRNMVFAERLSLPEHDDGGLFDRTIGELKRRAA